MCFDRIYIDNLDYKKTNTLLHVERRVKVFLLISGTGTFGRVVLCRHQGTPLALKILSMVDVIRLKQVEHARNEITVLKEVKHPFIVNM